METRVTYTAAASSMDSWDMENLKYLKKISKNNPHPSLDDSGNSNATKAYSGNSNLELRRGSAGVESGTYKSNSITNMSTSTKSSSSEVGIGEEEIFIPDIAEISSFINYQKNFKFQPPVPMPINGKSLVIMEENDKLMSTAPLDTCYMLDVVTIRNESVLAVRHPKSKLGSDGSSSSGSSIVEGNFFDDVHEALPEFKKTGRFSRAQSRTSTDTTLIEQQNRGNAYKTPCPYCDNNGMNNEFFYLGQKGNFEETSMIPTLGGEAPELPRTPSPYYVRLRRDLMTYTPQLRQPRNFGMDKQGQLLIDYSPNWAGLEKYILDLKRC